MKVIYSFILFCFQVSFVSAQFNGTWNGELDIKGFKLPIVFNVAQTDKSIVSTFDSPKQSVFGSPVELTTVKQDSIFFNMNNLDAVFKGKLNLDSDNIEGEFIQRKIGIALILKKGAYEEVKPNRPQEPKPPFDYVIKNVKFENKKAGVTLAGTLTTPDTINEHPVVVLISGSGPQDRDESLMDHKPFWVIAHYLTKSGYAVLRYDDRGIGESTGLFAEATSLDFSYDAEASIFFLESLPYINKKAIGFAGHSEGGMIAPMIAARNKKTAFIILLAGPGVSGKDIIVKQTELIGTAEGDDAKDAKKSAEVNNKLLMALLSSKDSKKSEAAMRKVFHDEFKTVSPEELAEIPDTAQYINENIAQLNTNWFRFFVSYNPVKDLQKVKCPVLALNGSKDLQIDAKQNLIPIEAALKKGKNKKFEIKEIQGLNHLFQHTTTGKISEYSTIEETFAPEVLEIMRDWLNTFLQ